MSAKTYWNLLVLFCVLCQGIIGTLSEKDIDESSEILARQKRVINRVQDGDIREQIQNVPYVVSIKQSVGPHICVGVILTQHIVLTAAKCVKFEVAKYRVYSGTAQISIGSRPVRHTVIDKRIIYIDHPVRSDGIALITVNPPFTYSNDTHNIGLYEGHIQPGLNCTISGWGCNPTGNHPGTAHPNHLRSITVPIISNYDCTMLYFHTFPITESDICTLDATDHQYCGDSDTGAPLVIKIGHVNQLVGVHLWNGGVVGRSNPDVFVKLQYPRYKTWIAETIHSLEAHLNIPTQKKQKRRFDTGNFQVDKMSRHM